jgi:hypothetical protein
MPRIELDSLIGNMTPEQKILASWFYSQFDNRSAANRRIINVEPLFYQGTIAGTEFLVYAATKLYLCLSLNCSNANLALAIPFMNTYNEANAVSGTHSFTYAYWNTTTLVASFGSDDFTLNNIYFSRLTLGTYGQIIFNGYRITLV